MLYESHCTSIRFTRLTFVLVMFHWIFILYSMFSDNHIEITILGAKAEIVIKYVILLYLYVYIIGKSFHRYVIYTDYLLHFIEKLCWYFCNFNTEFKTIHYISALATQFVKKSFSNLQRPYYHRADDV